jgi:hypothetical protein
MWKSRYGLRSLPGFLQALWLASCVAVSGGGTCLDLADAETGRKIASHVLRDGDPVVLTWRNSQFALMVTEVFVARAGVLTLTRVTFADPQGLPPAAVRPQDLDDLYHTGGAFSAQGLSRPFRRIVFRVGEIGKPRIEIRGRTVDLEDEVGFGGRVILETREHRACEPASGPRTP